MQIAMDSDEKCMIIAGWRYGNFTKKKKSLKKKKCSSNAAMLSYSAYFLVFVMALENACLYFKIVLEKESLATF